MFIYFDFLSVFLSDIGYFLQPAPWRLLFWKHSSSVSFSLAAILWVTPTGNGVCTCTDSRTEIKRNPYRASSRFSRLSHSHPAHHRFHPVSSAGRAPFHAAVSEDWSLERGGILQREGEEGGRAGPSSSSSSLSLPSSFPNIIIINATRRVCAHQKHTATLSQQRRRHRTKWIALTARRARTPFDVARFIIYLFFDLEISRLCWECERALRPCIQLNERCGLYQHPDLAPHFPRMTVSPHQTASLFSVLCVFMGVTDS